MNVGITLLVSYFLNFGFIAFILFFDRRDSPKRFSWLLAITFIPIAGIMLYLLFSGNFLLRYKRLEKSIRHAEDIFSPLQAELDRKAEKRLASHDPALEPCARFIRLNRHYAGAPLAYSKTVYVFTSGEENYRTLFAEIRRAQISVSLSYFIIRNDATGRQLISILAEKARQGVEIRLLYDHIGSLRTSDALFEPLKKAGGEVRKFFPVTVLTPYSLNYRNHRKIAVIDHRAGYFGGINIGDEYANCSPKQRFLWRDTQIRVTGEAALLLEKCFLGDWYSARYKTRQSIAPEKSRIASAPPEKEEQDLPLPSVCITDVPLQIVTSGPNDVKNDEIRDALLFLIAHAKKSVHIETPYFTPDEVFFSALKIAALSGIEVQIILPGDWDKFYVKLAAMPYISDLAKNGVQFFHYNGFIHAKMFVIDGEIASVGSTNIDTRSFSLHFELNAFFYSPQFAAAAEGIFRGDLANSTPADPQAFDRAPLCKKAVCNFFKLFAPLM